jgi:hypothetical protein
MVRLGGGVGLFMLVSDVGRAGCLPAALDAYLSNTIRTRARLLALGADASS